MLKFLRWVAIVITLWVVAIITTIALRFFVIRGGSSDGPGLDVSAEAQDAALRQAQDALFGFGSTVFAVLLPIIETALEFGVILAILIYAAERLGLTSGWQLKIVGNDATGIQAVIALIVVGTFSLSALTGLGSAHIGDLKDIALVVVGFYFGTRRRDADSDEVAAVARSRAAARDGDNGGAPPLPPLNAPPG